MNLPTHALTCSTLPNWYKRNPLFPKYSPLISTKTLHPKCMSHFKRKNAWAMMAKRKYQEEMSDEGSLKAVEDKKSKWQMRRATRNCWKLWNVSSHHYSNLSFRPWGHLNVGEKCGGKTTVCSTLERILPTFTRWLWRCWNHSAHNVPAAQAIMPVPQPAPTQETLEVNIHLHFSCRFSFCITYISSIISLPSSRRLPTSTFVSFVVLLARVILH